jgi:hypothetical protein
VVVFAALAALQSSPAAPVFDLTEAELAALPGEAREKYQSALEHFERQDHGAGFRALHEAAAAAPDSAPVQLVLGKVASNLARTQDSSLAPRFLEVAEEAYQRVLRSEGASEVDRAEATERLRELESALGQIERSEEDALARQERLERGQELMEDSRRTEAAHRAAEEAERAERAAEVRAPQPAGRPGDPPRYTGSNRNMMAIQESRDLRNASLETDH